MRPKIIKIFLLWPFGNCFIIIFSHMTCIYKFIQILREQYRGPSLQFQDVYTPHDSTCILIPLLLNAVVKQRRGRKHFLLVFVPSFLGAQFPVHLVYLCTFIPQFSPWNYQQILTNKTKVYTNATKLSSISVHSFRHRNYHTNCEWMTLTSLFLTRRRLLFILFVCCNVKSSVMLFDVSKIRRSNLLRCLTVPGCCVSFLSESGCYVQGCPEFLKAFAVERLCEYIRDHLLSRYALNCNCIGVDVMLQVMMSNVNVFSLFFLEHCLTRWLSRICCQCGA